jgi:hypothetical protein
MCVDALVSNWCHPGKSLGQEHDQLPKVPYVFYNTEKTGQISSTWTLVQKPGKNGHKSLHFEQISTRHIWHQMGTAKAGLAPHLQKSSWPSSQHVSEWAMTQLDGRKQCLWLSQNQTSQTTHLPKHIAQFPCWRP